MFNDIASWLVAITVLAIAYYFVKGAISSIGRFWANWIYYRGLRQARKQDDRRSKLLKLHDLNIEIGDRITQSLEKALVDSDLSGRFLITNSPPRQVEYGYCISICRLNSLGSIADSLALLDIYINVFEPRSNEQVYMHSDFKNSPVASIRDVSGAGKEFSVAAGKEWIKEVLIPELFPVRQKVGK